MLSVLKGLYVDRERMASNLGITGGAVLAEPAYILLAECGEAEAHERMRRITLLCEREGLALRAALEREGVLGPMTERLGALGVEGALSFFDEPARYRGKASQRARAIGEKYRALLGPVAACDRAKAMSAAQSQSGMSAG